MLTHLNKILQRIKHQNLEILKSSRLVAVISTVLKSLLYINSISGFRLL